MIRQLSILNTLEQFSQTENTTKPQPSSYLHIEGNIPSDLPEGTFISLDRQTPPKLYSLGFQPAKSIPEIPRWFLQKYASLPFTVLDPFVGSGTSIIESLTYGASVYWLDYNPLSRLICKVKTTKFDSAEVLTEVSRVISKLSAKTTAPETINFSKKDFWFQKPVQEALEIIREQILEVKENDQPIFWLAFASTVRKTSDMNDGMILAAKRSNVKPIPLRSRSDVFRYFDNYLKHICKAVFEWQYSQRDSKAIAHELPLHNAKILEGDWVCNAIITSPPYINAIDYVWASKFELHWLGLVKDDKERLDLYSNEIGTERIPRHECKELGKTANKHLDQLIDDIYTGKRYKATKGQNQLRARVVYKYFMDMKTHFESSFVHLKPGGHYCFAIGDVSKICGVDIPVASLLTKIAIEVGFSKQFHFHVLLKNRKLNIPRNVDWASTIKHDTVVVLQKPLNLETLMMV